jgi:hypothetical protein
MAADALESDLSELVALLEAHGEEYWADWLSRDLRTIKAGDAHRLDPLLGAFGGMGSLNDLVVHPMNGHRVDNSEVDAVNSRLDILRGRIWTEATSLRQVHRSRG